MIIIYRSQTGFTRQYAQMLGQAEGLKVYSAQQAAGLPLQDEEVFYMGPLMAWHISGLDRAVRRWRILGVCGVGMSPDGPQVRARLAKSCYVPAGVPLFYLQGGWAPEKVGWLKRRAVGMATRSMRLALQEKGSGRTPEEQAQLEFLLRGGSYVSFDSLKPIRAWMKAR